MKNDVYKVITLGELEEGFNKAQAVKILQTEFALSKEKATSLIEQSEKIVKQDLTHKKAYLYQQKLAKAGLKSRLQRVAVYEKPTEFTIVPDGEETTPFHELAARHEQGETVICKHCNTEQPLTPYCCECKKQLIAKAGAMPEEVSITGMGDVVKILVGVIVAIIVIIAGFIYWLK